MSRGLKSKTVLEPYTGALTTPCQLRFLLAAGTGMPFCITFFPFKVFVHSISEASAEAQTAVGGVKAQVFASSQPFLAFFP